MVRRALQVGLAFALLGGAACSNKPKADDPNAVAAVCATRTRVETGMTNGKASVAQFIEVVRGLETAVKVAPKSIKPAFETTRVIFTPFVNALIREQGDAEKATVDKQYIAALEEVGREEAERASANVRSFYATRC